MHVQPKLLRVIQDQTFKMVGSDKTVTVDAQVISALDRNPREMVEQGTFRTDLYYRLAVIPVSILPLRDRPGDIPLLMLHVCKQLIEEGYPQEI